MMRRPILVLLLIAAVAFEVFPRRAAGDAPARPRFGFVQPQSRTILDQPMLDRYAEEFANRFTAAVDIEALPISDPQHGAVGYDLCRTEHLVGFIEPHRHWHVGTNSVDIQASFQMRDCDGNVYYTGESFQSQPRFQGALPQTQIDDVSGAALDDLIAKFITFRRTHQPSWTQMIQTGTFAA